MINSTNNMSIRHKPKDPLHPPLSIPIFPVTPSSPTANPLIGASTTKYTKPAPKPCPESLSTLNIFLCSVLFHPRVTTYSIIVAARKHKKTQSDINTKLHKICNIYSNLLSPTASEIKFITTPKSPTRGSQPNLRTTQGTPRAASRPTHEKKPSLGGGSIKIPAKPSSSRGTVPRPRGASSALAVKYPSPPAGLGSFVSAKGSIVEEKDRSVNPQTALSVKSLSYGKPEVPPTSSRKLVKIPVKLRLKNKASVPIHLRSMSDATSELTTTAAGTGNKPLQQTVRGDTKRIVGVTTPTSSGGGFHFGKDEKMREYKKAITVAASINSMRVKPMVPVVHPAPPATAISKRESVSPQAQLYKRHEIEMIRLNEPRLVSSQSVGSKLGFGKHEPEREDRVLGHEEEEKEMDPLHPGKKNKIEQARDDLINWIIECMLL